MWELTAVSSPRSPVYLMEGSAAKVFQLFTADILIYLVWEGNYLMRENVHQCFKTEKTLLSCLQTASLLASDDLVSQPLKALSCLNWQI